MPRKRQYQELFVYMNGIHTGTLTREATGSLMFSYDHAWLDRINSRPISLSMPLTEIPFKGHVVDCFFDNLLPDSELILQRIQARFNTPTKKSFDLLSSIGADCVGALQLLPQHKVTQIKKIQAKPINNHAIARLLKNYQSAPLGMDRETEFRISIAGAQEKTALLWYRGKWQLPEKVTPTSHIIKLPIGEIKHSGIDLSDSVENEWLCLKILSAYGLPVNEANMMQFEDIKVLVVKRFDRRWSADRTWLMRLPQEDFCQVLSVPPGLKYEADGGPGIQDIMKILLGSKYSSQDRERFMKSVFLFWVLGAIDGHAKNFSISIESGGGYQLTPLYDVISAYPIIKKRQLEAQNLKMAMSLKSNSRHYRWSTIQLRHWLSTAKHCQFPEKQMKLIIDDVFHQMDDVIDQVASQLPANFPTQTSESIFHYMRQLRDLHAY